VLRERGQWALLVQMAKKLVKKWHHSSKIWVQYGRLMAEHGRLLEEQGQPVPLYATPKLIMQRVRESVKAHKVPLVEVQLALAEFQVGRPEHGRSRFEEFISKDPQRTDLWSVYIDAEVKLG
jgi:rRNA biogenesis protein RRP5